MEHITQNLLDQVNGNSSPEVLDTLLTLMAKLLARSSGGISLPSYDYESIVYHGGTNNVDFIDYYQGGGGGTLVATVTFSYADATTSDDARVSSIHRTLPS